MFHEKSFDRTVHRRTTTALFTFPIIPPYNDPTAYTLKALANAQKELKGWLGAPKALDPGLFHFGDGSRAAKGESGFEWLVPATLPSKALKSVPSQVGEGSEMSAESVKVLKLCGSGAPVYSLPWAHPVLVRIPLQCSSFLS